MLAIWFALVGVVMGSFLNLCCDRLPRGGSIVHPASRCDVCLHPLSVKDLVPVLSYIWLRGRCRYCGASIPLRALLLELATGAAYGLLAWHYGLSARLGILLVYAALFLLIFVIDLEHGLILNKVTYPGMALALAFSFLPSGPGVKSALLGGGVGLVLLLVPFLLFHGGLGGGDVKLGAMLGLACGFPEVLVGFLVAVLAGGLVAGALLASGKKGRKDPIPFGPFLVSGAMVALIWGTQLWQWYPGL